jgi:aconitate hydratase
MPSLNSYKSKSSLSVNGKDYTYYSLPDAAKALGVDMARLPFSLKILLENMLRYEDGETVTKADVQAFADWMETRKSSRDIAYRPARVLMQDFTGVPAVVDLAAMRDAVVKLGGDPKKINPLSPVDLVIDHSVQIDKSGSKDALAENVKLEMQRNIERYAFLRWGQKAFDNFRVVPPGTGICHQVNLEYLAKVVWTKQEGGEMLAYPDTLVGTDSHTTMVNGLGVLGWGVGGIEAEAAMLGQPISMLIPQVVGFELTGHLKEGMTATDLVLTVTKMLRAKGVVGKFVEFYGEGLNHLPLADRATLANMAPEYGATCGIFPIDKETMRYMEISGRDEETMALTEAYAKAQGMWRDENTPAPIFTDSMSLDMAEVEASISGPKRPQDRVALSKAAPSFAGELSGLNKGDVAMGQSQKVVGHDFDLEHGDVVIAAITSCTNTSNPYVMVGAGLVAKKAAALGLNVKPWVKTSLAPGSKVVTEYLEKSELIQPLESLGFHVVGYGCTTCIGNSGPLDAQIEETIKQNDLVVCSVLSGNRNFEGRVHQNVRANYLASPPLVVAYALAGSMNIDITTQAIGQDKNGKDVFLKDIWPTTKEVADTVHACVSRDMFQKRYADVFSGDESWQAIATAAGMTYDWQGDSTYVKNPPYFEGMPAAADDSMFQNISGARVLAMLGDSVTTDHISPAGGIAKNSPAADYLRQHNVPEADFNSYGSRRGNHEVMMRGTFGNVRIKNEMLDGVEGGYTKHIPSDTQLSIYDAAMLYAKENTPLVIVAGKEYGTGSSRDWAAKGTNLLGVKAVIAESFERIHRSNLVGMGVLPLMFADGATRQSLGLDGSEIVDIEGVHANIKPHATFTAHFTKADGSKVTAQLLCRLDTPEEMHYFRHGGILQYVMRQLVDAPKTTAAA